MLLAEVKVLLPLTHWHDAVSRRAILAATQVTDPYSHSFQRHDPHHRESRGSFVLVQTLDLRI